MGGGGRPIASIHPESHFFHPVTSLPRTTQYPQTKYSRPSPPSLQTPLFLSVYHLVCLETWITHSPMQGRRRQKCMDRNPMSYSRNCTRYHASSTGLSTVHGELVKISQAVIGTRNRGERISFHRDSHVTNSLNCVTPDLVGDCQQKITRPTGTPGWVTVEEMIDSGTVGDHKIGSNCRRHFKTFQRVVSLDPLILPPAKNHGIEVKL